MVHIVNTYIEANVKEGSADLLQPQPPDVFQEILGLIMCKLCHPVIIVFIALRTYV